MTPLTLRRIFLPALFLVIGAAPGFAAERGETALTATGDTTIPASIDYQGYRVNIRGVHVRKTRKGRYLVALELINTGRRPVNFGPGFPMRLLQTTFDQSLSAAGLLPLAMGIRGALSETRLVMPVGAWERDVELWVEPDAEPIAQELSVDTYEPPAARRRREAPRADSSEGNLTGATDDTPGGRPVLTTATTTEIGRCSDLAFGELRVLERGRNSATVQFTLVNRGTAPLAFDALPHGLGMTIFISGTPRLTSSAKRIAQVDLYRDLHRRDGEIAAGGSVNVVQRVDTRSVTRYTGVLVAQVDSGQTLAECDETNNEGHVLLK